MTTIGFHRHTRRAPPLTASRLTRCSRFHAANTTIVLFAAITLAVFSNRIVLASSSAARVSASLAAASKSQTLPLLARSDKPTEHSHTRRIQTSPARHRVKLVPMAANFKNQDGTVNFDGVKAHLSHVKGKYAQNAKNYEANTGKKMDMGGQEAEKESGEAAGQKEQEAVKETVEQSK